ncbi:MAG: cobyrinate a,c-diamide synthase [Cyanobacteriota bacterium]|nr:cobyrinate a,c-diamide synthase [Cyanobacteriota bacterium]
MAAPCSGSGKTLVSLSLAALARQRGARVQTFKVGPDYLDPQLLGAVSGRPCRNLDPLLCGDEWVKRSFHWHASRADCALVEGVMGLFDGRGPTAEGSSAQVAEQLQLPVVLVVEASRQAGSVAALVRGFRDHGPPRVTLAGVVLNRVGSARHRALLEEALAALDVTVLGVLPPHPALELPSRHLGLLPPHELADLRAREEEWAHLAERHLAMDRLWPLLAAVPPLASPVDPIQAALAGAQVAPPALEGNGAAPQPARSIRSGPESRPVLIARDAAFHFLYPEVNELLAALGLEVRSWSPLADEPLPAECAAVVLPGGYPELHAAALAAAERSRASLARASRLGVPIIAECGGLLLLGQRLVDPDGQAWPMAGVLPFEGRPGGLSLGYRLARAERDGLLVRAGEHWRGHEFHRWQLHPCPPEPTGPSMWQLEGWGVETSLEGWTTPHLHATWLHIHWAGFPTIPLRLAAAIAAGGTQRNAASSPLTTAAQPPSRSAGA